ncbi:MAG: hypothetical protein DHS20C01_20960 [marine bacterium B5-7]|nr:MAG: hypothetical protein DHS20C01_20960 [marine bacterium B5-7]
MRHVSFLAGNILATLVVVGLLSCCLYAGQASADDNATPQTLSNQLFGEASTTSRNSVVRYLTLRNRTGDNAAENFYGDERDAVHAGECHVRWTPNIVLDKLAQNSPLYIPNEEVEIERIEEIDADDFLDRFVTLNNGQRPLVYVHGYRVGFEKGCLRAARFSDNLNLGDRLLYFSWPSDGAVFNYTHDEADAAWSVNYFIDVLKHLEKLFGRGGFDVVAHSLGARIATLAIVGLNEESPDAEPLVDRLVLVAADIDADIFSQLLPTLRKRVRQISIYVSRHDSALMLSREVHGYPRLGELGPHLIGLTGIESLDVSDLDLRRVSGHLYHLYNDEVVGDLNELINQHRTAPERGRPVRIDPTVPGYYRLVVPPH